jgi:hypothetical protein
MDVLFGLSDGPFGVVSNRACRRGWGRGSGAGCSVVACRMGEVFTAARVSDG